MAKDTEEKFRLSSNEQQYIKDVVKLSKDTEFETNKSVILREGALEKAKSVHKKIIKANKDK